MNGNYHKSYDGHYFQNTVIANGRSIHSQEIKTATLTASTADETISVQSKIHFSKDLIIVKDGKEIKLGEVMDRIERIERYLQYIDDGLNVITFDNYGNDVEVKF